MATVLPPAHFEDLSYYENRTSPSPSLQFVNKLPLAVEAMSVGSEGFPRRKLERDHKDHLPMLALLLAALRRVGLACQQPCSSDTEMDIGWPTDICHVTHVTFDQASGFLGLPVEFEPEIQREAPSASVSVFGVSPESMQCSVDSKGNSVPLILLLLQKKLYLDGGLKAEGIFRINPENGQEKHLRGLLNRGIVPQDMDVHCLAGLIKAWFRELPVGVFDILSPEQVLQCHTEEQCLALVKSLPPTQGALLDWAVNLMADVAQEQEFNKMNARNIAMVFAPNMTQMFDPVTALVHAVQVMNFLKAMVLKTLRERRTAAPFSNSSCCATKSDGDGHHQKSPINIFIPAGDDISRAKAEQASRGKEQASNDGSHTGHHY